MITASGNFVLYEGSKQLFSSLDIIVDFEYKALNDTFLCDIMPAVISTTTAPQGGHMVSITKASVDAKTGTGANPSDELKNQIDQVIADYLDAITENSALTFTVS